MKKIIMWAIIGKDGFYPKTWLTRRQAVKEHAKSANKSWKACWRNGDRVMKVQLIPFDIEIEMKRRRKILFPEKIL